MSVVARTNISVKSMRRRKVCKAGVRSSGGEEGEKTNVLAGELWPTGEGCSHETLQTAKVEREEKEQRERGIEKCGSRRVSAIAVEAPLGWL